MPQGTSRARISVVGIGTVSLMQMTREADAVLGDAHTLLVLHGQSLVLDSLRKRYGTEVIDLSAAYAEDKPRSETYTEVAAAVVAAAVRDGGRHAAFVTSGHPLVLVTPTQLILKEAVSRGIPVNRVPGVSSLDTVWADIGFDPGPDGALMFEATSLLLRRYPLSPSVPLFLWQVNTVETALYSTRKNRPERFSRLQEYLLRFYPPDHVAVLVHSASLPITRSRLAEVRLGELGRLAEIATSQHILYVPPAARQAVADQELARAVTRADHLHGLIDPA
ncbi:SAM-dependent methyltransferase [Streptomyces sp. DSM 44917]|uniref:SAM-dependent methyltransferase n=1 Tax=Streptomyces boetiae TaxID=3075541 RepID=A0ABU2L1M9_9ACTN|nr:SAM-dependent methyltransferase [Streptomyces sp. DSM 44917]MDT0305430.1 SAM-dependent methyltransferase [Streptomyces sp. DSM 44917]